MPGRAHPNHHQLGAGAGHRDIGQSFRFRHGVVSCLLRSTVSLSPMGIDRNEPMTIPCFPPERSTFLARGLPEVGTDHHRVLQPFAAMNSHHSHGAIGLVAMGLTGFWHRKGGMQSFTTQPIRCRCTVQSLPVHGLLHQSTHLLQVPQHPAPFGQIRSALTLQELGQTSHQTELGQGAFPKPQLLSKLIKGPFILHCL